MCHQHRSCGRTQGSLLMLPKETCIDETGGL